MLRSSLGFHTISLFLRLSRKEVERLIKHFHKYRTHTDVIRMLMPEVLPGGERKWSEYSPKYSGTSLLLPLRLEIFYSYKSEDRGIKWTIRSDRQSENYKEYVLKVTINPKILSGIQDYLTAATYDDMAVAIDNFNLISKSISPVLETFEQYTLQRIDYCINCALNELTPGCTYEQMMALIKRSDIPSCYKELEEYDPISHRMKSKPGSFYLMNGSVHVNYYSKYMKFQEQNQENLEKGRPPIPPKTMDAARDIIRLEVQCMYRKTYALSRKISGVKDNSINHYKELLNPVTCIDVIDTYYKKIIGRGDWYTLQEATRKIQFHHFNRQKEERLIKALKLVNDCRSVAKAKAAYQGSDLDAFKRTLNDLSSLRINPVTIPREWGIKHIPNLLYAYADKVSEECTKKQWEEEFILNYKKYVKDMRGI